MQQFLSAFYAGVAPNGSGREYNRSTMFGNEAQLIEIDPEKLVGTPVFCRTRVPIHNLYDSLESGESVEQFFRAVSNGVGREEARALWTTETT